MILWKRRVRVLAGLIAALALLVGAASCAGEPEPTPSGTPQGAVLLPSSPTALPDFTPARFQALLDELQGRPVVVNFWGSWCGPCYREAPQIGEVAAAFEGRVQFLGVDISDQRDPARDFIREFGWTFPSVFDPDNEILASMGLLGAPVTIIFDASGERVFEWVGAISKEQLTGELERLLAD